MPVIAIGLFSLFAFCAGARTIADHPELAKVFKKPAVVEAAPSPKPEAKAN